MRAPLDVLDARLLFEDAGVVDQRTQRPELGIDRREQPNHVGLRRHIRGDGQRLSARRQNLRHDPFRSRASSR